MKTFNEFIEHKQINLDIRECAEILSEMDMDGEEFINSLLEGTEFAEGWMDWLRGAAGKATDFVGRMGSAAGQIGKSVMDGGLRAGFKQAADTVSGPAVKFDKAEAVLQDLVNFLNTNKETKNIPSAAPQGQGKTVAQYIASVLKLLRKEKENIPKMQQAQVSQGYAPRGAQPAAQPQAAQPQAAQPQAAQPQKRIWTPEDGNPFPMKKVGG